MMSWKDEEALLSQKPAMTKAGSMARPTGGSSRGASFEAVRATGSMGRNASLDLPTSPAGSLPKAGSMLRGPGNAAEGSLGSEGWWKHMDHSQMNEPPEHDAKKGEAAVKPAGFTPQFGVTGQKQSLWADEEPAQAPAVPASPAAAPASAASAAAPAVLEAPASPAAAPPAAVSSPAPSPLGLAPAHAAGDATIKDAGTTGWWAHMDNGLLNQPAESAEAAPPGAVRKGERVMGGGFTPQFGVAAGNRYGSIFNTAPAEESRPVEEQVSQWAPFTPATACAASTPGAGDDDWTNFAAAPPAAPRVA
ncbi:hypothetical protein TSOC_002600 [Tetrabaena socialis]|uniref:Uncharacterized protein n=1 Tax=Tetrabaena socialis TaxID=47790 RepID=A0A2J8ADQ8_9CHLO|nr:hypothetical protein TSOC_002600 [Tetrabaena socialis]|eukprot:PNH10649.1 hypothetical protein TSOC_002600 [Tetrabaena socialis]